MADIEHGSLVDADGLHEPKGVGSLALGSSDQGKVYTADGAGSGIWSRTAHGSFYYDDIGTGTVYITPTAYTLVKPVTIGISSLTDFTHNGLGRLTYTGSSNKGVNVGASITVKHSSASLVDIFLQVYVNGVAIPSAQQATAALSGNYTHVSLTAHVEMATNDYIEIYTKSASGNVIIHSFSVTAASVS